MCILLYVDDLVVIGPDLVEISQVKSQLLDAFEMKNLGDLHYFLEIEVIHTPDDILLTQRHYVLNMMYKFGMTKCRSVSTPLDQNLKLPHKLGAPCDEKRFQQIVGSLIYLTITRPDLNYPVGLTNQFMSQPIVEHLQWARRILWYVSYTKDKGLLYRIGAVERLICCMDADCVGNSGNRRSTSSFVFSLGSVVIA